MTDEDRTCCLCEETPGLKRRVQVLPWKMVCIYVCRACEPRMVEAITKVRAALERST